MILAFEASGITLSNTLVDPVKVNMEDVTGIEIGGPGRVTSGGGFIGGGFGLDGAATGMLVAGALNALTSRASVLTVISIYTRDAEVWLAHSEAEPAALRVELAPAFVAVRLNTRELR